MFINGKQKRVRRRPTIDAMDVHEFIRRNADPIFLHEMEMWELMEEPGVSGDADEMRDEHGFSGGVSGKFAARYPDLTMVVEPEGEIFVSRCPELDIATWGYTAEDTWADLAEAVELYFEAASQDQTHRRL